MGYYLDFSGDNKWLTLDEPILLDDMSIFIEFIPKNTDSYQSLLSSTGSRYPGTDFFNVFYRGDQNVTLFVGSANISSPNGSVPVDTFNVVEVRVSIIDSNYTRYDLYLNGDLIDGITSYNEIFSPTYTWYVGASYAERDWYNGYLARIYGDSFSLDMSDSMGSGTEILDSIGTNNAVQSGTGWPADDSEWVFYSSGPVTPINPSITNLLATSARLNWEQG